LEFFSGHVALNAVFVFNCETVSFLKLQKARLPDGQEFSNPMYDADHKKGTKSLAIRQAGFLQL